MVLNSPQLQQGIAATVADLPESVLTADTCDWHLSLICSRLGGALEQAELLPAETLSRAVASLQADVAAPILDLNELSLTVSERDGLFSLTTQLCLGQSLMSRG